MCLKVARQIPLKVLIFEYLTGGGLRAETVSPKLLREGAIMRRALLEDLRAADRALEISCFQDDRYSPDFQDAGLRWIPIGDARELHVRWCDELTRCDAVWPIAPESGGILEKLCAEVEEAGLVLLNSPASAVRVAASKRKTIERLSRHGVPVVDTIGLADGRPAFPWSSDETVIKPDGGTGCEGARIVPTQNISETWPKPGDWIAQPLLEGEAISLSVLFAEGAARLLSVNRQLIARCGNGFKLLGCRVNVTADRDGRWQGLADDIARALPELWGYAGVDLIHAKDGPRILEVNPRLTTSYAGLRQATGINPAARILHLLRTGELPPAHTLTGEPVEIRLDTQYED